MTERDINAERFSQPAGLRTCAAFNLKQGFCVFAALALLLMLASYFTTRGVTAQTGRPLLPMDYVGDDKCLTCHQDKQTYWRTAHHLTSQLPTKETIAGNFSAGANILQTTNPELFYRMEAAKDGFYQTAVLGTPPDTATLSERFDLVLGSGRKGQTYLYWRDNDQLFELPVSYWTELQRWINSPGYEDGQINFSRPVAPRCLECHASAFESRPAQGTINRYNKTNYILGLSCEKCHGPGPAHLAQQHIQGGKPADQAIINPSKLARARQIEVCALCHGGLGMAKAAAFSYLPGQPLAEYLQLSEPTPGETVDVHGNQVALLERSRCFQASTMTCSTCHNVHLPQRDAAAFSARCLSCHRVESCGLYPKLGHKLADNCVDCHMPKLTSNTIISLNAGAKLQPQVRTHWIKVYPAKP
jgi:Cytochrome c554 and c-prime